MKPGALDRERRDRQGRARRLKPARRHRRETGAAPDRRASAAARRARRGCRRRPNGPRRTRARRTPRWRRALRLRGRLPAATAAHRPGTRSGGGAVRTVGLLSRARSRTPWCLLEMPSNRHVGNVGPCGPRRKKPVDDDGPYRRARKKLGPLPTSQTDVASPVTRMGAHPPRPPDETKLESAARFSTDRRASGRYPMIMSSLV